MCVCECYVCTYNIIHIYWLARYNIFGIIWTKYLKNTGFRELRLELKCKKFKPPLLYQILSLGPFGESIFLCVSSGHSCLGDLMRWSIWSTWPSPWVTQFTFLRFPFPLKTAKLCCDSACPDPLSSLPFLLAWKPVLCWTQSLSAIIALTRHDRVCLFSLCPLASYTSSSFSSTTFYHSQRAWLYSH